VPPYLRTIVEDAVEAFDSIFLRPSHLGNRNIAPRQAHPLPYNVLTTGLQVLTARDTLTGLTKARFDNQLFKTNKALLEFAD
jgi:hypothetical protein